MSGVSRRDFLKAAALTGAGAFIAANKAEVVRAFEMAKENGVKLVWLQGQSCSACTVSLLQASDPELYDAIEELKVNIAFHQTIMQPFGDQAIEVLENIEPDVLVVEGAIPVGMKEACLLGERNGQPVVFEEWVRELMAKTKVAVVGFGSCSTYGGIPAGKDGVGSKYDNGSVTGAVGLYDFVKMYGMPSAKLYLLPGCPGHPDWLMITLASLLLGVTPEVDEYYRPKAMFSRIIHDHCPRRGYYGKGQFAYSLDETDSKYEKCLYKVGCKAPFTYAACAETRWNGGINVCMNAGAPCIGCMDPGFPDNMSPFYEAKESTEIMFGLNPTTLGQIAVGAAVLGVGAHAIRRGTKHPEIKDDEIEKKD